MASPNYVCSVSTATFERWFVSSSEHYDDIGGTSTITQEYIIRRNDEHVVNYNGEDLNIMIVEGVIPAVGDLYVDFDAASARGLWQWLCRCRSVDFTTIDAAGRCKVTVIWSTMAAVDPKTIAILPGTIPNPNPIKTLLPSSIEYQATVRSTTMYQYGTTGTAMSAPPSVSGNAPNIILVDKSASHIGGLTVKDLQGIDHDVAQCRIRMRLVRDATVAKMTDNWSVVKNYIGKMHLSNNTTNAAARQFFGFDNGTIICENVTMTKLQDEYYEIVFDFLWDEYNFCDQKVTMEPWGDPKLNGNTLQYEEVLWQRKPRTPVDFNAILSSEPDTKTFLQRGYWEP